MAKFAAAQLPDADPAAIARAIVLRKLASSAKTRAELAKTLTERNVPAAVAENVLDRFVEVGLIDDELYAQSFAQSRHEHKGYAPRAIKHQLANKGVAKSQIEDAVATITQEQEIATAIRLAEKKLKAISTLDPAKKLERIVSLLARKGYAAGICYSVAKQVLASQTESIQILEDVEIID